MSKIKELSEREEKELTALVLELFSYDSGKLHWKIKRGPNSAGSEAGTKRPDGYYQICLDGRLYFTHHLVWVYFNHEYPKKHIDHIDRDISNNKIENLRLADQWQNVGNRSHTIRKSGLPRGVNKSKSGRYFAMFRNKSLGTYDTVEEAEQVYLKEMSEYYGEYAINNQRVR